MANSISYSTTGTYAFSPFFLNPVSAQWSFPKEIIKVSNINNLKNRETFYQANQTDTGGIRLGDMPDSDESIDYLSRCANELIRNKDGFLIAGGVPHRLPVRRIALPSGRAILAGYLGSRLVVAHEDNYYIEDLLQTPVTVTQALGQLLAYLNPQYILTRPAWLDTALNWISKARDPLIFPQANGQQSPEPPSRQPVYSANAEISAHLAPADTAPRALEVKPAPAPPTVSWMPEPLAAGNGSSPDLGRFFINEQAFNLAPANPAGRAVLQQLASELLASGVDLANGNHHALMALDGLIASKAEDIFYNGLYFKDKGYVLHILLLKTLTENLLMFLLKINTTNISTHRIISQHMANHKTLRDYIPNIDRQLVEAYENIDIDIISQTVSLLKNKDFSTFEQEELLKINNTSFSEHAFHVEIYNTLKVMKTAYDEYTAQLFSDDHTTMEKVTYITNLEIYAALLEHNKKTMTDSLLKLRFYYIFEYTRVNEISIHANNFLLPGEMTNHWYPFAADEKEIVVANMEALFVNEVENYIHLKHNKHPHMNTILKMVELSRLNEIQPESEAQWQEKNIAPWDQAYAILSEMIISNVFEKEKFQAQEKWYNDFKSNLHEFKSTYILFAYLRDLQRTFINTIDYYIRKNIILVADSAEQYIAVAKIEAMRSETTKTDGHFSDYQMLLAYQQRVLNGDFELMVKAAVFWYLGTEKNLDENLLASLHSLYILKTFVSEQQHFFVEYKIREQASHLNIYQLVSSDKKNSLEDYYQQFYDYKRFYSAHEARKTSLAAIDRSTIDYVDAIYPPKEIFCFEVFSRNYVHNSLSPFNYVYLPHKNIGYLSLLRLQSGKLFLLSTLSGYVFIHDLEKYDNQPLLQEMMDFWRSNEMNKRPEPMACEADLLAGLFPVIDANSGNLTTLIDMLLFSPENEPVGMPAAPYTLAAVNSTDIMTLITPYLSQPIDSSPPVSIDTPLITNIDYLSQATLLTIADRLKETLHNYSWPEYIASFIPFFDTLCQHWNDKEHEIKFNEIMFDLFDLMSTFLLLGGQFKKIPEHTLKHALHNAIKNNTPRQMLKQFIINELMLSAPEVGKNLAMQSAKELAYFFFPLQPYGSFLSLLGANVKNKIGELVSIANEAIRAKSRRKKNLRQAWKTNIDPALLETKKNGVLVDTLTQDKQYYVVNDNDYFKVFWDKHYGEWRIANRNMVNEKYFAIPVMRSGTGNWIASIGSPSSHFIASFDFYKAAEKAFRHTEITQGEPRKILSNFPVPEDGEIDFYKRVIRFYLYKNDYVRDIIKKNALRGDFLGRFHRSFFFRKEIIDAIQSSGYSQDENFLASSLRALTEKHDGIMRFRAICGWTDKHALIPDTYFALRIDIENYNFIIDLQEMRGSFNLLDNRDVFTEDEWLGMYNKSPLKFELIKYKDIDSLEDANFLTYREATSPSSVLKNGFLLKEPAWYYPLMIKKNNGHDRIKYSSGHKQSSNVRLAARALRHAPHSYSLKEEFPLKVLYKSNNLDNESAIKLARMVKQAKVDSLNSHAILTDKIRITSNEDMLKINEGNLLALYSTSNLLEHLLLCQGHGRFVGVENHFFGPDLPARVSIVIAEQMGRFTQGLFSLHHTDKILFVMAGKAFGSKIEIPTLMNDLPRENVPIFLSDGQQRGYRERIVSREKILLGKDCHIDLINEAKTRLSIRLHGAPFNVNNMDAIEFSDIVRGLPYLDNAKFKFQDLESIELFSCYSGYGRRYSTGQILADELGLPIKAYPYKISDDIRQRRPEWFTWFRPGKRHLHAARGSVDSAQSSEDGVFSHSQKIHRRLHDLINFVLSMQKRLLFQRDKRGYITAANNTAADGAGHIPGLDPHAGQMPVICVDILQQLYGYAPSYADIPRHIQTLSASSLSLLDAIIAEYHLTGGEEHIIVEQAFLDVILSLEEYRYLSDWFNNEAIRGERH
ncbi:hypothetical protein [Acerihabitans sp.]|uniref:hypothetical protein n=1 Tax=Acerihabitans sp. TaxID=2811394 RepID=UPI002ED9FF3E